MEAERDRKARFEKPEAGRHLCASVRIRHHCNRAEGAKLEEPQRSDRIGCGS